MLADFIFLIGITVLSNSPASNASKKEKEEVSIAFLEYLGEWETNDGEYIEPTQLEKMIVKDHHE